MADVIGKQWDELHLYLRSRKAAKLNRRIDVQRASPRFLDLPDFNRPDPISFQNRDRATPKVSATPEALSPSPEVMHGLRSGMYSATTRLAKLDFPRFNGDKIKEWLFKVELFFEIDNTPADLKVSLASLHLDDIAATWHLSIVQSGLWKHIRHDWVLYKMLLQEKANKLVDDTIVELQQLHETNGIEAYHARFELISSRVKLDEGHLVNLYLTGLPKDTQMNIKMFHPQSIQQCLVVGRLYEKAQAHWDRVMIKTNGDDTQEGDQSLNVPSEAAGPSLSHFQVENFSSTTKETSEDFNNGPGVRWSGSSVQYRGILSSKPELDHTTVLLPTMGQLKDTTMQPQQIDCGKSEEIQMEKVALEEKGVIAHISVNAISGIFDYRTMRVKGSYGKHVLYIFIDSSSTHNFMDPKVAEKLKCALKLASMAKVSVDDGRILGVDAKIDKFQWEFRGTQFEAGIMVMPLGGCDMVLGSQWLETLGPITFNFYKLEMQFRKGHKKVILQGIKQGSVRDVKAIKLHKLREYQIPPSMICVPGVPTETDCVESESKMETACSQFNNLL